MINKNLVVGLLSLIALSLVAVSLEDARVRFKQLAKKFHPDTSENKESTRVRFDQSDGVDYRPKNHRRLKGEGDA